MPNRKQYHRDWKCPIAIAIATMVCLLLPISLQADVQVRPDYGTVLFSENFEAELSERWVERGFPSIGRKNLFSVDTEPDGNQYLKVESARSYSGMGVYLSFSSRQCPLVTWRWKIDTIVEQADITRKDGDDAAAKLYVVFDGPSFWNPLDKRILVYVWDNTVPVSTVMPNAWLPDKERMLILESGKPRVGQWVEEQIDLFEDFRRAFPGEEPGEVEALAFLADTDNTQSQVTAGFDDLTIRCEKPVRSPVVE